MLQETSKNDSILHEDYDSSTELTVQERQFRLSRVSKEYLEGKAPEEELQQLEEALGIDYAKAALDQTSVFSEVVNAFKRWQQSLKKK